MATDWTNAQLSAITSQNKTLLVSAAAGSGKTATLTERIIRKLTDAHSPADISKMLIVTFTRASAADLKAKISASLREQLALEPENEHLASQLVKLNSAHISTIDSFYLDAVRKNFAKLSLSSHFRIADESETDLLAKNVMDEVILDFYDTREDFPVLCECFEKIRDTGEVMREVLLDLYDKCMHVTEGVRYVSDCAANARQDATRDFLDTCYGGILKKYMLSSLEDIFSYYEVALDICYGNERLSRLYAPALESDRMLCLSLVTALKGEQEGGSYSEIATLLSSHSFAKLGSLRSEYVTDDSLFCKELRAAFKGLIKQLCDEYFCYSDKDFHHFLDKTAQNLELISEVLSDFDQRFLAEKKRRNILELTDVKRYALDLFVAPDGKPTKTAIEYSTVFKEIYIDEYQDVDPVQDAIFSSIASPTGRFMVGDIKQSIYGFRGAEPSLFARYRSSFAPITDENATASTIFMSENFRCSKPIIDFTNLVCSPLFAACGDSIGYTPEDDLVYGLKKDPSIYERVKVAYFANDAKKSEGDELPAVPTLKPAEAEAEYIAENIAALLKDGKKVDGSRILPKDIAVLFRSNKASARVGAALSRRGIKSTAADSLEYFQNPDVLMVLCILNAVDNPQRDVYLAGAMRSPIFNFSLEDILLISKNGCDADSLYDKVCITAEAESELALRCRVFNEQLLALRASSIGMPIDKFLKHLFASDAFVASGLFSEKASTGEGGNLLRLYEYARSFEAGSFKGLYNFIEFINTVIENGATLESVSKDGATDSVTLTTIHKSKGLEFPVCFVSNAGANMSPSHKDPLSFAYNIGIAMDLADNTGFAHYESPLKKILELHGDLLSREEEMRVLYVALTRARERLFVTGSFSKRTLPNIRAAAKFNSRFVCRYSALSRPSYLDWVLSSLSASEGSAVLEEHTPGDIEGFSDTLGSSKMAETVENGELTQLLSERFAFVYPHSALRRIPAKLSVSRLSPDLLDENDVSRDLYEERKETRIPDVFLPSPAGSSSAERGTATHQFLQFCDFSFAKQNGAKKALDLLIEKRFIPAEYAELVYMEELQRLLDSDFCDMILSAKRVIREQRFNMLLPATRFTSDESLKAQICDEKIAVQGVIDLLLISEDGSIGLFDYKTDRLTREELSDASLATKKLYDSHAGQLKYYAEAVRQLFGRSPDRISIYSTHASRLYDLPIEHDFSDDIL